VTRCIGSAGTRCDRFDSLSESWSTKSARYSPPIPRWNIAGTAEILRTISRFQVLISSRHVARPEIPLDENTASQAESGQAFLLGAVSARRYWLADLHVALMALSLTRTRTLSFSFLRGSRGKLLPARVIWSPSSNEMRSSSSLFALS